MLFLSVAAAGPGPGGSRPRVRWVRVTEDWLTLHLADGRRLRMPTRWSGLLANASRSDRDGWRVVAGGGGVAWPALGEIVSLRALAGSDDLAARPARGTHGLRPRREGCHRP